MTNEKTVTDNGNNSIVADVEATDNRHIANGKAAAIVAAIVKNETALAITAKEHGTAIFRSVYQDGQNLDTLIGESKLAAGFATLGGSDAGKKAKQRLNVYFSNYRLVAERWNSFSDEQRANVLNATTSVHYLAAELRKADADAKRAADKAAKEAEAAANPDALTSGEAGLIDAVSNVIAMYQAASMDERNLAFDALTELFALVDADTTAQQPEADAIAA
jgi:hypothetical protein